MVFQTSAVEKDTKWTIFHLPKYVLNSSFHHDSVEKANDGM